MLLWESEHGFEDCLLRSAATRPTHGPWLDRCERVTPIRSCQVGGIMSNGSMAGHFRVSTWVTNVQAEVKLPAYRNLSNRQLDSRVIFQFGVSRAF